MFLNVVRKSILSCFRKNHIYSNSTLKSLANISLSLHDCGSLIQAPNSYCYWWADTWLCLPLCHFIPFWMWFTSEGTQYLLVDCLPLYDSVSYCDTMTDLFYQLTGLSDTLRIFLRHRFVGNSIAIPLEILPI